MTFDVNGYPSEETLNEIEKFDLGCHLENLPKYLDLVFSHWEYSDWGVRYKAETGCLMVSTAGWSGNESLISSMKKTPMFFPLFWYKTKRGGHYWFELFQFGQDGKKCDLKWGWDP